MIEKEMETLDNIIKDGTTFTHMSGKVQTKEEYFGEIADGTLNYRLYKIENFKITIDGDKVLLEEAIFAALGKKYGKTSAQLIQFAGWHPQFEAE